MASLDQQIGVLIQQAPKDDVTATLVSIVAPLLKQVAGQLTHLEYYVLQTHDGGWVVTTLGHRKEPELEKAVVYAFPALQDAQALAQTHKDAEVTVAALPVIEILFQLIALKRVDSILFWEMPGQVDLPGQDGLGAGSDRAQATEVRRADLQTQMQQLMRQQLNQPPSNLA
jgi:hypothetical protein